MATEKRLIDANALITVFEKEVEQSTYPYFNLDEIQDEIIHAPTVDAVEVVRCKDCGAYDTNGCAEGFGWCVFCDRGMMDNDYCSHGERKDNDCT